MPNLAFTLISAYAAKEAELQSSSQRKIYEANRLYNLVGTAVHLSSQVLEDLKKNVKKIDYSQTPFVQEWIDTLANYDSSFARKYTYEKKELEPLLQRLKGMCDLLQQKANLEILSVQPNLNKLVAIAEITAKALQEEIDHIHNIQKRTSS